jgi:hypothetical protein
MGQDRYHARNRRENAACGQTEVARQGARDVMRRTRVSQRIGNLTFVTLLTL